MDLSKRTHRRYNILTGEWILVSPHRTKRPWQGKTDQKTVLSNAKYDSSCYLCPTNKRANDVVNPKYKKPFSFINDFAALLPQEEITHYNDGLLKASTEKGQCKVICFSPNHSMTLPLMQKSEVTEVIQLWKKEYLEMGSRPDINYVQIFENKGAIMGCSNPHPHGQIWSQYSIPQVAKIKQRKQKEYWEQNNKSLLASYLEQELQLDERILFQNGDFVVLIPYWAVWPYEAMILPKKHYQHIGQLNTEEEKSFAEAIQYLTVKYDNLFETSFPYSSGIHQSPTNGDSNLEWHFHMSFYPPLLRSAEIKKFMVGYEMFANPQRDITAEIAAKTLKNLSEIHYTKKYN